MKLSVGLSYVTGEISDNASQVVRAFSGRLEAAVAQHPDFASILKLGISTPLQHPFYPKPAREGRSYSSKYGIYSVLKRLDYQRWIASTWEGRIDQLAETVSSAIQAVPDKRITEQERAALLALVEAVRGATRGEIPAHQAPIGSVYLLRPEGAEAAIAVSYSPPPLANLPGYSAVGVLPSQAVSVSRDSLFGSRLSVPSPFKLYRKVDGRTEYREGWFKDKIVIEHWGVCGDRGETRQHTVGSAEAGRLRLKALKADARMAGFRSISTGRHAKLLVEYAVDEADSVDALDRRHALETLLDQELGWLGLGHCDGGSIGSGTMEAMCFVVDFQLAKTAIEHLLIGTKFADYRRIYRER